jgi:Ca-activated chloride channel family protein
MRIWVFAGAALALLAFDSIVSACFIHSPVPVELIEDHITIDVKDQVATKEYTCTFYNPNQGSVEGGTCYMEVEPGAQVDNMTLRLEGREVQGEILEADKARQVFQEILARGGSPALLEFYGNGLIRAQVPRIPPLGTVTAVLRYTTYLKADNGLFRMRVLNTNPKAWLKPLKKVTVNATIKSRDPIKAVYSPTHDIKVTRKGDHDVTIALEQENYLPKTPLALYWHVAAGSVGMSSIAYRDDEEMGYFMLMVSPSVRAAAEAQPKDVVFCMDTSGSMQKDERFAQMRQALREGLEKLNPRDRFNVVSFGTDVRSFAERPVEATAENRRLAARHVDDLEARGAASIEDALEAALTRFEDSSRPRYVVFLTDGSPGVAGEEIDAMAARVKKMNRGRARLFVVGVGNDVNTKLLDLVAEESGGACEYVMPRESVSERLADAVRRISSPVLTNLALAFEGVRVEEVYPGRLPDLHLGQQVVVFGRYRLGEAGQKGKVVLGGCVDGKATAFEYAIEFPAITTSNDFLPRIWAGRKVAHLIDRVRAEGSQAGVKEITRLAKQFGIVTPYTSYLVSDDIISHGSPVSGDFEEAHAERAFAAEKKGDWVGEPAAGRAAAGARLRRAQGLYQLQSLAVESSGRTEKEVMQKVRNIGPKTFYVSDGVWYDGVFDPAVHTKVVELKLNTPEYAKLIETLPGLAKYFSLTKVVVIYRGQVYRVA